MTKLDKNFYDKQGCATRLTATLKASITCAMLTIFIGTANADLLNTDVKLMMPHQMVSLVLIKKLFPIKVKLLSRIT